MNAREITRRAALGLIASGGALVVAETVEFTSVVADRGASIGVASDDQAYLGVEGEDENGRRTLSEGPFDSPLSVIFTNGANASIDARDLTVTIENQSDSEGPVEVSDNGGDVRFAKEGESTAASNVEIGVGASETFETIDAAGVNDEGILGIENQDLLGIELETNDVNVIASASTGTLSVDLERTDITIEGSSDLL